MDRLIKSAWQQDAWVALADRGWFVGQSVADHQILQPLQNWQLASEANGLFRTASIGKDARLQQNSSIRSDLTCWLPEINSPNSVDQSIFLVQQWCEDLRVELNRELFAGLESFEGHLSIYPPGGFYHRHIDSFKDDDARRITLIVYLNEQWTVADGGCLEMFGCVDGEGRVLGDVQNGMQIAPTLGTVVMFDSRRFAHKVALAKRRRVSFTGWFKVRSSHFKIK